MKRPGRPFTIKPSSNPPQRTPPAELMASTDPEVRQFVRGEPDGPVKFHYPAPGLAEDFGVVRA